MGSPASLLQKGENKMNTLEAYNETYTHYRSKSGNTQIYIYRRRKKSTIHRFIKHLLADNCYYLKQKLLGLVAVGGAIICPLLLDGDATVSVIMLPLGIYTLFTKEKVMMF